MESENRFAFTMDRLKRMECPPSGRPARDRRLWLRDTKIVALACSITESGSRTFYWYKRVGVKIRKIRLGTIEEMNVEQARRRAAKLNNAAAEGRDPAAEKRAERERQLKAATFGDLWQSYVDNWLRNKRQSTLKACEQLYRRHLKQWSRRTVQSIDEADVERLKNSIGQQSQVTANRVIEMIGAAFRSRGHIFGLPRGFSPTARVDKFPERVRSRVLTIDELAKVMTSIDADDNPTVRDYFRMVIFTGQRRNTVAKMRWDDIAITDGTWRLPGERTKNGEPLVLSLVPDAVEILRRRHDDRPADSPYVFTSKHFTPLQVETIRTMRAAGATTRTIADEVGISQTGVMHALSSRCRPRGVTAFSGAGRAWKRIVERAGISHATIHDLRRTYCTNLIERDVPLPIVAKAMGHKDMSTTMKHYAFASDKSVAKHTQEATADVLASVKQAQQKGGNHV